MIAILADIHSNIHALRAVLRDAERQGVDRIYCAGDLVGYGAYPNAVINDLKDRAAVCISGNHDRAVVNGDVSTFNPFAAEAVKWTMQRLSKESMDYLKKLPPRMPELTISGKRAAMFHGSPDDDDEYMLYVPRDIFKQTNAELVFYGHTHKPNVFDTLEGTAINPGSVGQPRDGDWRASYALLKKDGTFRMMRVEYDVKSAMAAIWQSGLPPTLGTRLLSGH